MITQLRSLKNHQGFVRYFKNTSWMFTEQILRLIGGLFVGIWVARYLGPKQFGIFSYALAFTSIFSGIAKLGLDSIVVRDLVHDPDKRDVYLGTAFWLKVAGAIIAFGLVTFSAFIVSNNSTANLYILIISSGMILQSTEVIDFYFQSKVLSKFVSICKIVQLSLSSLIKVYLVVTRADLFWFVLVSLIDQVTLGFSLIIAYKTQKLGGFYRYFDGLVAKKFLSNSWPLIFSALAVMLYIRIDQIMVKEILGPSEAGLYSAAIRLTEIWYFVPVVITQSIFPAIISAKNSNKSLYNTRLQTLYNVMAWMSIGIALFFTFSSNWLMLFLYGTAYSKSGLILKIHIWSGVFVSLGVASGSWLTSENLQKLTLIRTSVGAMLNILLSLFLIPRFGTTGAAISTLISIAVASYAFDVFLNKTRHMFWQKTRAIFLIDVFRKISFIKNVG